MTFARKYEQTFTQDEFETTLARAQAQPGRVFNLGRFEGGTLGMKNAMQHANAARKAAGLDASAVRFRCWPKKEVGWVQLYVQVPKALAIYKRKRELRQAKKERNDKAATFPHAPQPAELE